MEKEKLCDPSSRLLRGERDATVPLTMVLETYLIVGKKVA